MSDGEPAKAQGVAPAGWYAHPTMADTQRYWDGKQWTDHVAPGLPQHVQAAHVQATENEHNNKLLGVSLVLMLIFPIGGFIGGCVLLAKRATTAGAIIMLLSVASAYFWYDVYTEHQRQECLIDNVDRAMNGYPTIDCG